MRAVYIDIWWETSGDYDSYDSVAKITDEEYAILVKNIEKYRDTIDPEHCIEDGFDGRVFTDACCGGEIYEKIQQQVDDEVRESLRSNLSGTFDTQEEEDAVDEYIDNTYGWGFYLSSFFIDNILAKKTEE